MVPKSNTSKEVDHKIEQEKSEKPIEKHTLKALTWEAWRCQYIGYGRR